jgi:hypothetical protein
MREAVSRTITFYCAFRLRLAVEEDRDANWLEFNSKIDGSYSKHSRLGALPMLR